MRLGVEEEDENIQEEGWDFHSLNGTC
jgi:hypothetical protein